MNRKKIQKYIFSHISSIAVLALILSLLLAGSSAYAQQVHNGLDTAKLDAYYASQIAANHLKGMAVVIVNRDQVIYQSSFGMAGKDIAFTHGPPSRSALAARVSWL